MLASHCALCGSTGRFAMGVFQTLSAGNMGQLGAPGTGVPADATPGRATLAPMPRPITVAATNAAATPLCRRFTGVPSRRDGTAPAEGEVTVVTSGYPGSGKAAGSSPISLGNSGVNLPSPQLSPGSLAKAWVSTPAIIVDTR